MPMVRRKKKMANSVVYNLMSSKEGHPPLLNLHKIESQPKVINRQVFKTDFAKGLQVKT